MWLLGHSESWRSPHDTDEASMVTERASVTGSLIGSSWACIQASALERHESPSSETEDFLGVQVEVLELFQVVCRLFWSPSYACWLSEAITADKLGLKRR